MTFEIFSLITFREASGEVSKTYKCATNDLHEDARERIRKT